MILNYSTLMYIENASNNIVTINNKKMNFKSYISTRPDITTSP